MTLTGTITLDQSGPESNSNEGIFHTPQSSGTEALPSTPIVHQSCTRYHYSVDVC